MAFSPSTSGCVPPSVPSGRTRIKRPDAGPDCDATERDAEIGPGAAVPTRAPHDAQKANDGGTSEPQLGHDVGATAASGSSCGGGGCSGSPFDGAAGAHL